MYRSQMSSPHAYVSPHTSSEDAAFPHDVVQVEHQSFWPGRRGDVLCQKYVLDEAVDPRKQVELPDSLFSASSVAVFRVTAR